jgi:hypothetical protein
MHFFHLIIGELVRLDKRRQIRVEDEERLRAGPLVLHDAQEVHHLVAQRGQVLGRLEVILPGTPPSPS